METKTSPITNSLNRSPLRAFLLIPFVLTCFALSPQARAVCQQGCDISTVNTFLGDDALVNNTTGTDNTANGALALHSNTTGFQNTATGVEALFSNTTGFQNTATGVDALFSNTIGSHNTAVGQGSLGANSDGHSNTATGAQALSGNRHGSFNTGVGLNALLTNENGSSNTAVGNAALFRNTGSNNIGIGDSAGLQLTSGSNNIALGNAAGIRLTAGDDNIYIGNFGKATESNTIRIGMRGSQTATFIAGISRATVPTGVAVIVDADGHLGTTTSSARYKEGIKPMDKTSEAILALNPVTFRYKHDLDPQGISQFGLVAEEVEKVNPDLVARDAQGKPYTVRYEAVNAMLLNEFLKEHKTVQEQGAIIARLEKQVEALTAGLQKVSAQLAAASPSFGGLDASKFSTQVVADNQ
jgi:hypothetical protein